ncbi:hypothetical protein [Streptococcus cristatus]|uniref:Uncharacterized protein n=1 Tax=Streptococcus cristatus TaxID=45634 RepID=A0A3R9LWD1_STRCR|nr:hypothetical protein [Streptococcus cristatus]RSJ84053.1 hypothetical protein D8791_02555 [Streptococcus cristatus]
MSTKTTYGNLTKNLDRIADNLHQIGEQNNLVDLSLLSVQLGAIKEDLARLLWVELPELNDGSKLEKLFNKSTGMFFSPGIFEIDAMRQAFFKRQAQAFFTSEEEQQAYLTYTEKLYLGATKTFKEIMKDTNQNLPNSSYQEKQARNIEQFTADISNNVQHKELSK